MRIVIFVVHSTCSARGWPAPAAFPASRMYLYIFEAQMSRIAGALRERIRSACRSQPEQKRPAQKKRPVQHHRREIAPLLRTSVP